MEMYAYSTEAEAHQHGRSTAFQSRGLGLSVCCEVSNVVEAGSHHYTCDDIGLDAVHLDEFHHDRAPLPKGRALLEYANRERRFGQTSEQVGQAEPMLAAGGDRHA